MTTSKTLSSLLLLTISTTTSVSIQYTDLPPVELPAKGSPSMTSPTTSVSFTGNIWPIDWLDIERFLRALSAVESHNNPNAIGKKGERTQWQISQDTWESVTRIPWSYASDPAVAKLVATTILYDKIITWKLDGPFDLAVVWNLGKPPGRILNKEYDFAKRVCNLYLTDSQ